MEAVIDALSWGNIYIHRWISLCTTSAVLEFGDTDRLIEALKRVRPPLPVTTTPSPAREYWVGGQQATALIAEIWTHADCVGRDAIIAIRARQNLVFSTAIAHAVEYDGGRVESALAYARSVGRYDMYQLARHVISNFHRLGGPRALTLYEDSHYDLCAYPVR